MAWQDHVAVHSFSSNTGSTPLSNDKRLRSCMDMYVYENYLRALLADACLKGLNGVQDVVECSYVRSSFTELPFFASKVGNRVTDDCYDYFGTFENCWNIG